MAKSKKGEKKKEDPKEEQKELDFKEIAKELANVVDRQHIAQLGPAITHEFLEHAKYVDEKGVVRFKEEYDQEDAEKLIDRCYDTLGYHLHRRFLKIPKDGYEKLKEIKDPNGKPYVDMMTEYHFEAERQDWKKKLARKKKGNKITLGHLQELLEEPVQKHSGKITLGILDKNHLRDPRNMDRLKGAIDEIVKEFNLDPKEINTKKMYDPNEVIQTYMALAKKHYVKGAHAEPKKEGK